MLRLIGFAWPERQRGKCWKTRVAGFLPRKYQYFSNYEDLGFFEENPRSGFSSIFRFAVPATRSRLQYFTIFPFHPEKLPLTRSLVTKIPPPSNETPRKNIHLLLPSHNKQENSLRSPRTNQSPSSPHTRTGEQREREKISLS